MTTLEVVAITSNDSGSMKVALVNAVGFLRDREAAEVARTVLSKDCYTREEPQATCTCHT